MTSFLTFWSLADPRPRWAGLAPGRCQVPGVRCRGAGLGKIRCVAVRRRWKHGALEGRGCQQDAAAEPHQIGDPQRSMLMSTAIHLKLTLLHECLGRCTSFYLAFVAMEGGGGYR